jgi:hypothetical protein
MPSFNAVPLLLVNDPFLFNGPLVIVLVGTYVVAEKLTVEKRHHTITPLVIVWLLLTLHSLLGKIKNIYVVSRHTHQMEMQMDTVGSE